MASSQRPTRQSSRWGGFLQQAVASVESRLDTILAEENENSIPPRPASTDQPSALKKPPGSPRRSEGVSRASSNSKSNARLQERLARAVVSPSPGRPSSPASSIDSNSRVQTPGLEVDSLSLQTSTDQDTQQDRMSKESSKQDGLREKELGQDEEQDFTRPQTETTTSEINDGAIPVERADSPQVKVNGDHISREPPPVLIVEDDEADSMEKKWQEESREYIERIDALQSKLQYLAKEVADSAKNAAAAAKAGSHERKLIEKDEKIALLMEEGQQLSKKEMSHLSTLRKMRAQASDAEKAQANIRKRAETAESAFAKAEERAKRAEAISRRAEDNLKSLNQTDRDVNALSRERDALNATVADIKAQLQRAVTRAESAEAKAQTDALDRERRKLAELQDDLTSAKIERELSEEKLRREIRDLKANREREQDQAKSRESELRGEQSVLESKLESLRTRAEESSSDAKGESQAKLLRQIEQLQSQYSLASENWHGIENSLLARLSAVEKERDDSVQKDAEARRKLRESSAKLKKADAELEKTKESLLDMEQTISEKEHDTNSFLQRSRDLETKCHQLERDFERRREEAESAFTTRLAEERRKWLESSSTPHTPILNQRTESPGTSIRKASGFDVPQYSNPASDRAGSRRQSALPMQVIDTNVPTRQNSFEPIPTIMHEPQTPSISSVEHQEFLSNGTRTPLSPPRGVNEILSASTVAAGPSVQLVERMSASVRRLESERATSKDELARLTAQRDEARQEVVELMREVEQKRALDKRVAALQEDQTELNARYQATLEMLGEKSEQVEELKADVADVKEMYRELVDRTMK
ncbi:MAG: hypothetical protein Q9227_000769 [Pyrenula ochraceoflavens]